MIAGMIARTLRISTRKSPLALWQANFVKGALLQLHPTLNVELVKLTTQGDRILGTPLSKVGGKGLFVKELEQCLLRKDADIAVHSAKDMPAEFADGLCLAAICERADPCDAFVSQRYTRLDELPAGAIVGTSSLRRSSQISKLYPELCVRDLRGNVGTRLTKLDDGEYDAIILACAGLQRLGEAARITQRLTPEQCLPAVGQGIVAVECRTDDHELIQLLRAINHLPTQVQLTAERAMNKHLNGGCQIPIAGFANLAGAEVSLRGMVGKPDGSVLLQSQASGPQTQAAHIGVQVAEALLAQGAGEIIKAVYDAQ